MNYINVGIGEFGISKSSEVELRTFALGSCVAVVIFDPVRQIGGLAHIALPDSAVDLPKSKIAPCYFANTGIPKLLEELGKAGATLATNNLVVKIAGGFNTLNSSIGVRNVEKVKAVLSSLSLCCQAEDTGGNSPRTVYFRPNELTIRIHSPEGKKWEI